jgi:hypothetical protein
MLAGSIALLTAIALVVGRQPVGLGVTSIGGIVFDAALALVGCGAAVLAAAGQGPVGGRGTRRGLAVLAFGTLVGLAASLAILGEEVSYNTMLVAGIVQLVVVAPAVILGLLIMGVGLMREDGLGRLAGRGLVGGAALIPVAFVLTNIGGADLRVSTFAGPVAGLAAILIIGAMGAVGFLALSDRWSWR